MMAQLPYIAVYLAAGAFVVAVVARVLMWSRMPLHLRWELYPVAHEGSRAHYGGSYLEEVDWWKKPREVSLLGELKVMLPEILFLVALKEHNRKLWLRSFPFHFGIYLCIVSLLAMFGAGVLTALLPAAIEGSLGAAIQQVARITAIAGLGLGILGALGLLQRRLSASELREFTAGADLFNLAFFVVAFGTGLLSVILFDPEFSGSMAFFANLVRGNIEPTAATGLGAVLPTLSVVLLSALVIYIPLTHMSHFVGKFFAYHQIRWADKPNLSGGPEEKAINQNLQRKVSWAAPHIEGKGSKTWADLATELPSAEQKEKK